MAALCQLVGGLSEEQLYGRGLTNLDRTRVLASLLQQRFLTFDLSEAALAPSVFIKTTPTNTTQT